MQQNIKTTFEVKVKVRKKRNRSCKINNNPLLASQRNEIFTNHGGGGRFYQKYFWE